jgi:predicted transcriptional regulator
MAESIRRMSARFAAYDRERKSRLIYKRRDAGLTQADVARIMGVRKRWVEKFERYDSDPRLSEVRRYEVAVTTRGVDRA